MPQKESYRHILPHFQQPGQAYFITWNLKDAVSPKALKRYSVQMEILKSQIDMGAAISESPVNTADRSRTIGTQNPEIADQNPRHPKSEYEKIQKEYYSIRKKYIKAYNDLLDAERNPSINLSKQEITKLVTDSLQFFHGKKIENYAFCIMPNHVHWVFKLFEKDDTGEPVYLENILYSVKRFSAGMINKLENRKGALWQKESFDTTIRDEKHLYYCIEYTLNNPVKASLVKERKDWPGSWTAE